MLRARRAGGGQSCHRRARLQRWAPTTWCSTIGRATLTISTSPASPDGWRILNELARELMSILPGHRELWPPQRTLHQAREAVQHRLRLARSVSPRRSSAEPGSRAPTTSRACGWWRKSAAAILRPLPADHDFALSGRQTRKSCSICATPVSWRRFSMAIPGPDWRTRLPAFMHYSTPLHDAVPRLPAGAAPLSRPRN